MAKKPQESNTQPEIEDITTPPDPQAEVLKLRELYQERSKFLLEDLDKKLESEGIKTAVVILMDPKVPDHPIMYSKGNAYSAARLACVMAQQLKQKLFSSEELSV